MAEKRENWGSKLGVILAVAGSAVGLGNFLVFPGRVVANGGGAFLIPYFIAFVLIGIPVAWMEWSMGRMGGRQGHGSGPGVLNALIKKPYAKYLGSLGVVGPMLIFFLYIFLESWILGYCWYSLDGSLTEAVAQTTAENNVIGNFFGDYIFLKMKIAGIPSAILFFAITFFINFAIVFLGVRKGIESSAKVLMPILIFIGFGLVLKVITMKGIDTGFGYMWNPDFSKLKDVQVWFDATTQVFFTTSVGIGSILTYASYVKKDQDIALSSLTANATNELLEVVIGGTIVIPVAVLFLTTAGATDAVKDGAFSIGFKTMPLLFGKMGAIGPALQFSWFLLLFIGGVTSSVSILQPGISFLEDELKMKRKKSVITLAFVSLLFTILIIIGFCRQTGADNEIDLWGFQLSLLLFGAIEAVLFSWVIGVDKGWEELNHGSDIKVPLIFKAIMKYITPTLILTLLAFWLFKKNSAGFSGIDLLMLKNVEAKEVNIFNFWIGSKHFRWDTMNINMILYTRFALAGLLVAVNLIIYSTWRKRKEA